MENKTKIKIGDLVRIHCPNKKHIAFIYDNKIGKVLHIFDINKNPWGNYHVKLENGCNNCFYEDELELVIDEDNDKSGNDNGSVEN